MIRQKRSVQLEFRDGNEEQSQLTVGDLRDFIKLVNSHKLSNDQPVVLYRDPYRVGFTGLHALWEEWNDTDGEIAK